MISYAEYITDEVCYPIRHKLRNLLKPLLFHPYYDRNDTFMRIYWDVWCKAINDHTNFISKIEKVLK